MPYSRETWDRIARTFDDDGDDDAPRELLSTPPAPAPALASAAVDESPPLTPEEHAHEEAEQERWNAFFDEYRHADVDTRVRACRQFIEAEPDISGEAVFDLMSFFVDQLRTAGRVAEVDYLLDYVAEHRPEAYRDEELWFDEWRLENALLRPGTPILSPLRTFLASPRLRPHGALLILDALTWHGRTDEVVEATRLLFERDLEPPPGAEEDFAASEEEEEEDTSSDFDEELDFLACEARIVQLLALKPDLTATSPRLLRAIDDYDPPDEDFLEHHLDHLRGRRPTGFGHADLTGTKEPYRLLQLLCSDFSGHLVHQGWPALRALRAGNRILGTVHTNFALRNLGPRAPDRRGEFVGTNRSPLLPPHTLALITVEAARHTLTLPRHHQLATLVRGLLEWPGWLVEKGLVERGEAEAFRREIVERRAMVMEVMEGCWDPGVREEVGRALG